MRDSNIISENKSSNIPAVNSDVKTISRGLTSFNLSTHRTLSPILNKPKYIITYKIVTNWKFIIGEKYKNHCVLGKINLIPTKKKDGKNRITILINSYNSATSFFLNGNLSYIRDRINVLFGYDLVDKILLKETLRMEQKDFLQTNDSINSITVIGKMDEQKIANNSISHLISGQEVPNSDNNIPMDNSIGETENSENLLESLKKLRKTLEKG